MRFERQLSIGVLALGMTIGATGLARGEDAKAPADAPKPEAHEGRGGGPEGRVPGDRGGGDRGGGRIDPKRMVERMQESMKDLNLSEDQKSKIKEIGDKAAKDLEAAMKDAESLEPQERMAKMREVMMPIREKMMDVLDETQREKLREKMQNAAGGRGGPDGAGPRERGNNPRPANGDRPERPEGAGRPDGARGPREGGGPEGPGQMLGRLKDNLSQLGLNDDQKKKVDALLGDTEKKMDEIRAEMQKVMAKNRETMDNNRKKLDEILTDEQKQKLQEMMPPRRPDGERGNRPDGDRPRPRGDGQGRPPEKQ